MIFFLRIEFVQEQDLQTPRTLAKTYQPKDQSNVEWLPIWKIIETYKSKYNIDDSKINLLRHAWLLKERSLYYKENFCQARIGFLKSDLSQFDVDRYWQEHVYRFVKNKYFEHYRAIELLTEIKDASLDKFIVTTFKQILDGFETANLSFYLYNNLSFSSSVADLSRLITEKSTQGFNMFLLCHDYDLIQSSPSKWNEILTMFVDKFSKNGDEEKTIGVLVDYDLHADLSSWRIISDFFKRYFLVYNLYSDKYLESNENYAENCELITREFIESTFGLFF